MSRWGRARRARQLSRFIMKASSHPQSGLDRQLNLGVRTCARSPDALIGRLEDDRSSRTQVTPPASFVAQPVPLPSDASALAARYQMQSALQSRSSRCRAVGRGSWRRWILRAGVVLSPFACRPTKHQKGGCKLPYDSRTPTSLVCFKICATFHKTIRSFLLQT